MEVKKKKEKENQVLASQNRQEERKGIAQPAKLPQEYYIVRYYTQWGLFQPNKLIELVTVLRKKKNGSSLVSFLKSIKLIEKVT